MFVFYLLSQVEPKVCIMCLPLTTKNLPQLPGGWNSADQKTELGSPQSAVAGIVTDTDLQSIITINTAGAGGEVIDDGN